MYSFKLDIGSLTVPVIGGGYIDVDPVYNGSNIVNGRGADDLIVRKNLSGELEFRGADYTALKALFDTGELYADIRVYIDTTIILSGDLSLNGKYITNGGICNLIFTQDDAYSKILANLDKEYNLVTYQDTINHDFTTTLNLQGQGVIFDSGGILLATPNLPFPDDTGWTDYYFKDNGYQAANAWVTATAYNQLNVDGTGDVLYGDWSNFVSHGGVNYMCFDTHTSGVDTEPGVGGDWATAWKIVEDNDPIPAAGLTQYSREEAPFEFDGSTWNETDLGGFTEDVWVKAWDATSNHTMTQPGKSLFDILESLLSDIDSTIDVFEVTAGADTGYCEYTENSFVNSHYKFIYSWEDEPKISLQEILDIYKVIHNCDWRVEDNIFVFRHPTERPASTGGGANYDLTTYKSTDWTVYTQETSLIDNISRESWKFADNNNADWDKSEFTYDNNFNESKEHSINFETDIKHAIVKEEGTLIMAATDSGTWDLSNTTGIISGETEYNGYLAVSYIVFNHHKEGRPFGAATFNGSPIVLTQKRNTEIRIKAPYFNPDTLDIETYLVQTNNGNLEVRELSIKLGGEMAELTCVK